MAGPRTPGSIGTSGEPQELRDGNMLRYFERLAALCRPRRTASLAVLADPEGLQIGGEQVLWSDVRRMDAFKRDIYVGDFHCLAILAADGRVFEIDEEAPGWNESTAAIARFLPGSLPRAQWTTRLIAASQGESVPIYRADAIRRDVKSA